MKTILHIPNNKAKLKQYISILRKNGGVVEFDNYIFDTYSLFHTTYECDSSKCLKLKGKKYHGCCCTDYTVDIEPKERKKLEKFIEDNKAEFAEKYPWVLKEKVFKKDKSGIYLNHRKDGSCILSVIKGKALLCLVDLISIKKGLKRTEYKPAVCYSWPLETIKVDKKIFVTTICGHNGYYLSQQTCALGCVSGKMDVVAAFSLAEQLEKYLGKSVVHKLIEVYAEKLHAEKKEKKQKRGK
jgi:hypothetical protein